MKVTGKELTTAAQATVNYAYPWTPDAGDGTYRNPIL